MKKTKLALLHSTIALLLCCAMLVGTTFAWFTDSITSGVNRISAGNLDVELEYLDKNGNWQDVTETTNVFAGDTLWEPGHTEVVYLKISNAGTLALKYQLGVNIVSEIPSVNVNGDPLILSEHIRFGAEKDRNGKTAPWADRTAAVAAVADASTALSAGLSSSGVLYAANNCPTGGKTEQYLAMVVYLPESVGNEANYTTGKNAPEIMLGITLVATQQVSESDSFGSDYDAQSQFPALKPGAVSEHFTVVNGKTAEAKRMQGDGFAADVPVGVKVTKSLLTLSISEMAGSAANISLASNELLRSLDVHMDGVAADNTVPMKITVEQAMMVGLNIGNFKLYHVENGVSNAMTAVGSLAELDAHNEFYYDPATGDVTLCMATFSEVALVADIKNAWNGNISDHFAGGDGSEASPYLIASADQLAYFNEVISNENAAYAKKYYKLLVNINLGGKDNADNGILFYPIGYHAVGGNVAMIDIDDSPEFLYFNDNYDDSDYAVGRVNAAADDSSGTWYTYGGAFQGVFDGDGHKISNIYQSTWQLRGSYDGMYWNAAMGIFGYVYNGTVQNLSVDNFSSDGEFTPTGVIAAYATNSTFKNIAITNCNPRVYNTGNGGIVGIGGSSSDTDAKKMVFENITVDNTNKISAMWNSWDVACGGLMGMFRGHSTVTFTNCHVGAQIDVFNDVCGNYQYYWYRYAGMMIGSLRGRNTTDAEGYTVPDMTGITATDCTVHFGNWNDYYYCELVANTIASYTHEYQFSRLEQISDLSEIKSGETWTKAGNFLLIEGDTKTCYHIVSKNGTLVRHNHADAGEETVNGETLLKEDNQIVYLPFNQLFQGDGWGVKHIPIYNGEDYAFAGITILDRETASSVEKFESTVSTLTADTVIKLGDIFSLLNTDVKLIPGALTVTVTNEDDACPVSAVFNRDVDNWANGTLQFSGTGVVQITIQDYYFCTPTTITVTIEERQPVEKFASRFTGDFLYRIGNSNAVSLGSLFSEAADVTDSGVSVALETVSGNATGSFSKNTTTWSSGTLQFSGTGIIKVTITDNDYCVPTELTLEVVDAVNATSATSATANNVVLLKDCGFSSLTISGGYAIYGNGFTMTCASDSAVLDFSYSFVTLSDGTLDNVQIVCPNFDYAALYKSNLTSSDNRSETTDRTRYYNAKSGVMASGNSQILNSRISGGRASVNVAGGNVLIDNSRIELGAVASVLVGAANSLTLRDVTLVQKPTVSTYDSSKTLMGFSVLFVCDANGDAAPITLEGNLVQNAWVDESDKQYVPSAGQSIISNVLSNTAYLHDIDGDGTAESLNLGFAYMPESLTSAVNTTTITDNRADKTAVPYDYAEVSILNGTTYVYSYKNTNGTADSFKTESQYKPTEQSDIITVTYADTSDGLTSGKSFSTNGWVYELNVDLDKLSGYALDFSKLTMTVNGVTVTDFKVNGGSKPSSVAVAAGGTTYTLTATIDGIEYSAAFKVTGTETTKESPSLVASNYEAGLLVGEAGSKYGNKDTWHGAAPVLNGIQIKYWSVAEKQYKTITLSDYTPTTAGAQNGTNASWTYTAANNDFTLTITNETAVHSSNNVYAMPVVVGGKLYFVASSSNGLVNYGNSARTVKINYSFADNNGGDVLKFEHTWSIECPDGATCYDYSDFCSGTASTFTIKSSNGSGCVTPDTLVTLADGTQKRIDQVTYDDLLLVWNFYTGEYAVVPSALIQNHGYAQNNIIQLTFSDGTVTKAINEHGYFDATVNAFVMLTPYNAAEYIGHAFVKADGDSYITTTLVSVEVSEEYVEAYSILSAYYYNFITDDLFSLTSPVIDTNFFMPFAVGENMTFDAEKMAEDIANYGLYEYADFEGRIPYDVFEALNIPYLKVAVGKGLITHDEIVELLLSEGVVE